MCTHMCRSATSCCCTCLQRHKFICLCKARSHMTCPGTMCSPALCVTSCIHTCAHAHTRHTLQGAPGGLPLTAPAPKQSTRHCRTSSSDQATLHSRMSPPHDGAVSQQAPRAISFWAFLPACPNPLRQRRPGRRAQHGPEPETPQSWVLPDVRRAPCKSTLTETMRCREFRLHTHVSSKQVQGHR